MLLSKYKEKANLFTGKASEINRQLAFAGIAIIWLFRIKEDQGVKICDELMFPLILFVVTLFVDILQYIYSSTVWTIFFRYHEKKNYNNELEPDIKAPKILSNISYVFFYLKLFVCLSGFFLIFNYLWDILF